MADVDEVRRIAATVKLVAKMYRARVYAYYRRTNNYKRRPW